MQILTSAKHRWLSAVRTENSAYGVRFTRFAYAIILTAILIIAYIWLYAGYQIGLKSNDDASAMQNSDAVLVRDFAHRLLHTIDDRDRLLKLVRTDDGAAAGKIDLQRYAKIFGGLYDELSILDAAGRVIASTGMMKGTDRSRSELYIAHRDNADDFVGIGRPLKLPGSDRWMMQITRRIFSAQGKFAGVVELDFAADQLPALRPVQASSRRASYVMYACIPTILIFLLMFLVFRALKRQHVAVRRYDALRRRANDANRRKSHFLTTVVHELRIPLNGVHGYAELLRDTASDAQSREFGGLIHQSASYLNGLLSTLFDLARIETGRVVIFNERIETMAFFERIGATHQVTAYQKQLTFRMTLGPDLPDSFVCDRLRLTQILHNLLDNAVKFTAKGGITMNVALLKDKLDITVLDTGPGIPQAELQHLFDYFYQSESVRARPGQGLGLGLSLTRDFTDLIRGSIRIASEVGVGTAVYLSLPLDTR